MKVTESKTSAANPVVSRRFFDAMIVRFLAKSLGSTGVFRPNADQLLDCLRRLGVRPFQRAARAMRQVVSHELARNASQRLLDRGDLHEYIGTISIFLDHFMQATHLPFDPAQARQIGRFCARVDGHGVPRVLLFGSVARLVRGLSGHVV